MHDEGSLIHMMLEPIWFKYALFDDEFGTVCGIRDDAPDDIKQAYINDMKHNEQNEKENIKV